jgi:RsiW-degrading membrane proteinase PrsW (M82 family)
MYAVYKSDKFPQNPRIVAITFVLGFSIILPIQILIPIIESIGKNYHHTVVGENFYQAFIRAALLEETMKFLIIIFYCLRLEEFNKPLDAIIYGVAASLGFALFENWEYVMSAFNESLAIAIVTALYRGFSAVSLHALTGIMMGFFIMDVIFEEKYKKLNITLAILFPVYLHGFYDFMIFSKDIHLWWSNVLVIIFVIRTYFIFKQQKKLQDQRISYTKVLPKNSDIVFAIFITFVSLIVDYLILNN